MEKMKADDLKQMFSRFKHGPSDVVGLAVQENGVSAVRLRKSGELITVVAADVLPPPETPKEPGVQAQPLAVPSKLKARYASIAVSGDQAVIKLLSFPGHFDAAAEEKVVENLGLDHPDQYRIGYKLISEGHGKAESRILAVALPEPAAATGTMLLPSGTPAPYSLEVMGLSTFTAFLHSVGPQIQDAAVGAIDFGANTSSFALFTKGLLALIRRFPTGTNTVLGKVQESLGVDRETAQGIISDGSFDISQPISDVMDPLIKQLIVSRDFVERRENCQITKMFASGDLIVSRDLIDEMKSSLGIEVAFWNPFQGLTLPQGAIPENLAGHEGRFSAALGAGLATFEET